MSRFPPRSDRGYQPLPGQGGPPPPNNLFERRSDRYPTPPSQDVGDYRLAAPGAQGQYGVDRRPVPPPQSSPGYPSKMTGRGHESPRQRGRILRVVKVA